MTTYTPYISHTNETTVFPEEITGTANINFINIMIKKSTCTNPSHT